ncbi:Gfo/Idh/MocA family protein [Homoserinibacter sp. YIM 151385]|uniref:Gfo/Idh/MocA family protein n=1 Tax=Homoserinibacter sp. YIM 151385 TaxID=2985506 RepID=UPI0022F04524|nr:Gfo/Idh/MocA family oxidoreductase [Homoserinibacter sp. YIM 151385]WBU36938.1 Gfo/Idh/MocA family oxidoreductase [Homoserinibacter sp. YIM 151385]
MRIRSAIVGGGMIAAVHRRAIQAAGGELVAVMSSRPERSAALADRWGVDSADSLEALLELDVDVVHVCSPNQTHAPVALAALRAGKHVVVEKPVATSAADAAEIARVAEETGLTATVPFVYRFHPIIRELRARRIRGDFGRWYALHGSYLQDWMLSPSAGNWRVDSEEGGRSRAFGDVGSHWCDLVEFVSGERFAELSATTAIAIPERPAPSAETFTLADADAPKVRVSTEDLAAVTMRTGSGILGNVMVSQVSGGRRNRLWFELDGAEASAVFDQEEPETAWIGSPEQGVTIARGAGRAADDAARLSYVPGGHAQGYQDCFDAFVGDTYAAIGGAAPEGLPTIADGLRSARIVDAVLASADGRGIWTEIEEDPA